MTFGRLKVHVAVSGKVQYSAVHVIQKAFVSSEPASILEHSTTHPCGRWICIFPYGRAHCNCCCCEEPLKQTYISVSRGRRRNLVLCAKSSLGAFSQICWEISRPKTKHPLSPTGIYTTCSAKPVGAHFGKCLYNQHLKQPGDIVSHSGIPQAFLYWVN